MSSDTVTRREARALDRALAGENGRSDPDGLLATAFELRAAFDFDMPTANRERAMFVSGVGTRHHRLNPFRLVIPAAAFFALIVLAYLGGRTALPGDSLYPIRKALGSVGLAESPVEEIDSRIGESGRLLGRAERILEANPGTSLRLAVEALEELGPAIDLLDELKGDVLATREEAIEALESRAVDVITAVAQVGLDGGRGGGDGGGDGAGPGSSGGGDRSGNNSGSSSNSGSGSGDDDDSGPGSGRDDDRSGSNSGPRGGDDDDDDDDRSGSNSGSGGSGTDRGNSGPGSGVDDDRLPDVDGGRNPGGNDNSGPGGGDDDDRDDDDDDDDDDIDLGDRDDDSEVLS